jgi:hypothetical protein
MFFVYITFAVLLYFAVLFLYTLFLSPFLQKMAMKNMWENLSEVEEPGLDKHVDEALKLEPHQ